jgi:hypothetical protein
VAHSGAFAVSASKTSFAIPDLPQDTNSRSFSGAESAQWEGPQQKKKSLPYRYLTVSQENANNNRGHMHVPSSHEFDPDHDTSCIMEDITMIATPDLLSPKISPGPGPGPIQDKRSSPDDEVFITPPTSPCITDPSDGSLIDPQLKHESELDEPRLFLQQTDLIQLPKFIQSRKRPFPEPVKPSLPRKASRGEAKLKPSNAYNVNSLRPTTPSFRLDDPFRNYYHDAVSASGLVTVPSLRRSSTSFDSVSTATTSLSTSSAAWSAPRSLASVSTNTTPNTSFRSDSLATSFNSNHASFYKIEVPRQAATPCVLPESKTTVRSAPNTPRTKRSNATLQRSATTSDVDAQADNTDPMDIDRRFDVKQESFSEHLGDQIDAQGIFSANLDVEGLSDRLRSLSLLRMLTLPVAYLAPFANLQKHL